MPKRVCERKLQKQPHTAQTQANPLRNSYLQSAVQYQTPHGDRTPLIMCGGVRCLCGVKQTPHKRNTLYYNILQHICAVCGLKHKI